MTATCSSAFNDSPLRLNYAQDYDIIAQQNSKVLFDD